MRAKWILGVVLVAAVAVGLPTWRGTKLWAADVRVDGVLYVDGGATAQQLIISQWDAGMAVGIPRDALGCYDGTACYANLKHDGTDFIFSDDGGLGSLRVRPDGKGLINAGNLVLAANAQGQVVFGFVDTSGTPGNASGAAATGRSAIAATADNVEISNPTLGTNYIVFISPRSVDPDCGAKWTAIAEPGKFVVTVYDAAGVLTVCANDWFFDWYVVQTQ